MTTNAKIRKLIKAETGYDVQVKNGGGYCYFYSKDEATNRMLSGCYSTSVYVCYINNLSAERWLAEFKQVLEDNELPAQKPDVIEEKTFTPGTVVKLTGANYL